MPTTTRAGRLCLVVALAAWGFATPTAVLLVPNGSALAQAGDAAEKEAFEAAKELGTVDAWNAFLASYATGFRADLARAYLKQAGGQGPAAPAAAPPPASVAAPAAADGEFPVEAGTWGGIVRSGPGQSYPKQASLREGEAVALMGVTPDLDNGFPWFKIWYGPEQRKGYMWGGILCAKGRPRSDVFQMCPSGSRSQPADPGGSRVSPGFDCARPNNDAERTICSNDDLAGMDQDLNSQYKLAVSNITSEAAGGTPADVARFRREQSEWIARRNDCGGDAGCLTQSYRSRLKALREQNEPE